MQWAAHGLCILWDSAGVLGGRTFDSAEALRSVRVIGAGLKLLGAAPDSTLGIWSSNRIEWMLTALGAFSHAALVERPEREEAIRRRQPPLGELERCLGAQGRAPLPLLAAGPRGTPQAGRSLRPPALSGCPAQSKPP